MFYKNLQNTTTLLNMRYKSRLSKNGYKTRSETKTYTTLKYKFRNCN